MTVVAAEEGFDYMFVDGLPVVPAGAAQLRIGLQACDAAHGPTLLFIPGAYHGAWCYAGWLKTCRAAGIPCAALDYRGHGSLAGAGLAPDTGVEAYADDVVAAARSFSAPSVLVGHSLGGLVAMAAAMRTPLAGLALVAPSPPGNLAGARALPAVDESQLRPVPARAEVLERFLGGHDGPHVDACMARLCPESPRALNQRYRLSVPIDARRIAVPALVIEAGLDCGERHPAGQDQAIADFLGGEFVHLAGAPHCMMLGPTCLPALAILLDWRAGLG